jgi:hypothetical protein
MAKLYTKRAKPNNNNKTASKSRAGDPDQPDRILGSIIQRKEGWIIAHIFGSPFERGFAHGFLLKDELARVIETLPHIVKENFDVSMDKYLRKVAASIVPVVRKNFAEFYAEIRGISAGAAKAGVEIGVNYIIAWNSLASLYSYYATDFEKCSAFIAAGDATKKGDIVMAHNSHVDFLTGALSNVILYVVPDRGIPFVMQTSAGFIASSTDWFICKSGIMGCETTISEISYKLRFGHPYFCRIRKAMQYGNTLDDYVKIMKRKNAGDYACSWLFGDVNSGEIMRFELGLERCAVSRTKNGVFYGMNTAMDQDLRENETDDRDFLDLTTSSGNRNIRLNYLLNTRHYGEIDLDIAKRVLSDHFDILRGEQQPNYRSICNHTEAYYQDEPEDERSSYPYGVVDGKATNSSMAKKLEFAARWGSSCNRGFDSGEYIKAHLKYKKWKDVLMDFPTRQWTNVENKVI